MSHKNIDVQHNDIRIIKVSLDNNSEILIWNVGYEINSVKVRINDTSAGEVQMVNIPGKIKEVKILDNQELSFSHESKK